MADMELFKGNALVSNELLQKLLDMNKKMAGGGGFNGNRISIRGGKFRRVVNGDPAGVSKSDRMNIIILNAAAVARAYYEESYNEKAEKHAAPTCWSSDTKVPDPQVPDDQRQATTCGECPMNVKGSGQGDTRACRFSQRLAIMLEGDLQTIYQLQVPAASIFGDGKSNEMGLGAYNRFLLSHETPAIAVITEMRFDEDTSAPKLFFSAVRPLNDEELGAALELRESDEALKAIDTTVNVPEGPKDDEKPKAKPKTTAKPKPKVEEPEEPEEPEEEAEEEAEEETPPKKVAKTKAEPSPSEKKNLAAVMDQWGDDED